MLPVKKPMSRVLARSVAPAKKGWDIGVDRSAQFTKRTRGDNAHAAVPLEREQLLPIAHHQVVGRTGLRQGEQAIVRRVVGALLYQR